MMTLKFISSLFEFSKNVGLIVGALFGSEISKRKIEKRKALKDKETNIHNHKIISSIYPIISSGLNSYKEIDRVSIFKSHNGNGIPTAGCISYTSCIQEVCTDKTTPIQQRWQKIPSDQLMMDVLMATMRDGHAVLKLSESKSGVLKDFCAGNNIIGVLSVPIQYSSKGFVFLNFCSSSVGDLSTVKGVVFEAHSVAGRISELLSNK